MLRVEIGTIDMDGYTGRDNHPKETDADQIGEVITVTTFEDDGYDDEAFRVYHVALNDGRTVELVESEIKRVWIDEEEG